MGKRRYWGSGNPNEWWQWVLMPGWVPYETYPRGGKLLMDGAYWWAAWCWSSRERRALLVVMRDSDVVTYHPAVLPGECEASASDLEDRAMALIRRAMTTTAAAVVEANVHAKEWVDSHPFLWEYLTLAAWDDGQVRQTSMLLVFVEDARFKVCLQDREQSRSMWVTADTVDAAFHLLENKLANDAPEWKASKPGTGPMRSKKR